MLGRSHRGVISGHGVSHRNQMTDHDPIALRSDPGVMTMYNFYPEWGPAKHRTEEPTFGSSSQSSLQTALDLRDGGAPRPDDN